MEISRFPSKRLLRMPGSTTTRGQHASCDIDTGCVAFCWTENISAPNLSYAAQYLACALPCERFTSALADIRASLGAGAVRYSFTVTDFHRLPLAGLPAHPSTPSFADSVGRSATSVGSNRCWSYRPPRRWRARAAHLRNFETGLFFAAGMKRLAAAGIDVFLSLGNHDAGNRFADKLAYTSNVHVFSKRHPETRTLDDVGVAVHGRSFPRWDIEENIALDYPAQVTGLFNVGVLHTACAGSEGSHARYAPCSLDQLVSHGYDYWALGHVHDFTVLSEAPHVVYSGNLQGRDPRETGAKGAVLVTVKGGEVAAVEHRPLDVIRWATVTVDATPYADRDGLIDALRNQLSAGDRPIALRIVVTGRTALHNELLLKRISPPRRR